MGKREDDMEVRYRQEFGPSGVDPTFFGEDLALRAVAIATRMVDRTTGPTPVTGLPVPAEGGRPTGLDGAQGTDLDGGQRLCAAHVAAMEADDVREFRSRASPRRHPVRKRTGHGSAARRLREIEQVEWRGAVRDVLLGQVEVAHRRADVAVTQETLNRVEVGLAGFQ